MVKTDEKQTALEALADALVNGQRLYTILRAVSKSGMSRRVSVVDIQDGEPVILDYRLVRAGLGYKMKNNYSGLIVSGAGFDAGYDVVYNLGRLLSDFTGEPWKFKHSWL